MESPSFRLGFTLVELMVVMAIMVVIMGIILGSQSTFNKTLILANTAYDIALTIRSAETYGIGSLVGSSANVGYGLHFDKTTPTLFTLFADTSPAPNDLNCHRLPSTKDPAAPDAQPGDCVYRAGQDRKIRDYTIGNGISISDFCVLQSGKWSCASQIGGPVSLDIVFARPNPETFISRDGSYSLLSTPNVCLVISSPQGGSRFVAVAQSGQITANASLCPW